MKKYHDYVKRARRKGHSHIAIAKKMRSRGYPLNMVVKIYLTLHQRTIEYAVFGIILALFFGGLLMHLTPTGMVTAGQMTYTNISVDEVFTESGNYTFAVDGDITSLKVSGEVLGGGVSIYLEAEDQTYVIYSPEHNGLSGITGNVIENVTRNNTRQIERTNDSFERVIDDYENVTQEGTEHNASQMVNDTVASVQENQTADTVFEEPVVQNTTRNISIPGISDNVSIVENSSQNTTVPNSLGNTVKNIQNTTVPDNTSLENTQNTTETYRELKDVCQETCLLTGLDAGEYTIRIELDNAIFRLGTISYAESEGNETVSLMENSTAQTNNTLPANKTTNTSVENRTNSTENITVIEQSAVEIGKSVRWVVAVRPGTRQISLPSQAKNISVQGQASVMANGRMQSLGDFNRNPGKPSQEILLRLENSSTTQVEYFTPGPTIKEKQISRYKKQVTVSSDIHYTDIDAYTDLPVQSKPGQIHVYWLREGQRQEMSIVPQDTDSNGLADRVRWRVPHLSNQTFEVSITVLTVQSYPSVGGYWTVAFETAGTQDLVISGADGTVFGSDIEHDSLLCGEQPVAVEQTQNSVSVSNYSCDTTSYHRVKVLSRGEHTQLFTYGDESAYAHNYASSMPKTLNVQGKLTNASTGDLINSTVSITFRIYDVFSGGSALWTESQDVLVEEGIYSAVLGNSQPLTLPFNTTYYLGIEVESDGEMTPRINLTSSPYSYTALSADKAYSLECTDCLTGTEIDESTLANVNADTLDTLDSTDFCQADGTNCPAGATADSPWTNNTNEVYIDNAYPQDVNISGELRIDGAVIERQGDTLVIRG